MAGPWETYAAPHPATLFQTAGSGPRAPSGFRSTGDGNLAAITGGPEDIGYSSRKAAAEAQARAAVELAKERQLMRERAGLEVSTHQQLQNIDNGGASALDPATITYYAQQVLAGAPMPSIGMGKQAAAARQAIMQEVARQAGAAGLTGADAARQIAHYKAGTQQLQNLEKMVGAIGANEQTAMANGQQYLDRSAELPGQTRFAPINALSNAIQRRFGGTTISAADAAYGTFTTEYAKVVAGSPTGAGTLSDSARHEAMSTISGNGSVAQKQAAFDQMKTDMANRMVAIHGGINQAYKALTTQPGYEVPDSTQGLAVLPQAGRQGGNLPPAGGLSGSGGGSPPTGNNGGDGSGLATGLTRNERDTQGEKLFNQLIRSNLPAEQINSILEQGGHKPSAPITQQQIDAARDYISGSGAYAKAGAHPGFNAASFTRQVPNGLLAQVAATPAGTALGSFADSIIPAGAFGQGAKDNLAAMKKANPNAAFWGDVAGIGAGAAVAGGAGVGLGALAGRTGGLAARVLANPLTADALYGGAYGTAADPNNRVAGGILGAVGGAGIGAGARYLAGTAPVAAAYNKAAGMFGRGVAPAPALSSSDNSILSAAGKVGIPDLQQQLGQAAQLGVPMSLADTAAPLTSLAGAAVRRSPAAAQIAEDAFLPRSRGQIDRLGAAVKRDLGPVANIPQQSADLVQKAQRDAAPLYTAAYGNAVPSTPEINSLLSTPFGRQALGRANTIAANERREPSELGFALDSSGSPVLNPQPNAEMAAHLGSRIALDDAQAAYRTARADPSADMGKARDALEQARDQFRKTTSALNAAPDPTAPASVPAYTQQTLDYVKRGMDDVLEQYRNPITNRLQLDEAGRAQNGVLRGLLTENDKLNPAFGSARAAYAGPTQARDALQRGQDAFSLSPDELAMQVGNQTPEHLAQMQLGFRSELMNRANNVRDATNPFEATLSTPNARARVDTLYPNNPGTANLFATRDLESGLARSQNAILGNSKTAERLLADQSFAGSALPAMAADAGLMMAGGVPVASMSRAIGSGVLRDAMTMGVGKRAAAKADQLAPVLFNTDPAAASQSLTDLLLKRDAYGRYINDAAPRRLSGMFGAGVGGALGAYLGQ